MKFVARFLPPARAPESGPEWEVCFTTTTGMRQRAMLDKGWEPMSFWLPKHADAYRDEAYWVWLRRRVAA